MLAPELTKHPIYLVQLPIARIYLEDSVVLSGLKDES